MDQPGKESSSKAQSDGAQETKAELIERLLAKAELEHKCCGSHCSGVLCDGSGVKDAD